MAKKKYFQGKPKKLAATPKAWQRSQTFVLEGHLWASALWLLNRQTDPPMQLAFLAAQMSCSQSALQQTLTARSRLTVDRAVKIANLLGADRVRVARVVANLEEELRTTHGPLHVLTTPMTEPPKADQRLLRAFQIEANMDGYAWADIFSADVVGPDDVWRARVARGMSHGAAAHEFNVSASTVVYWEKVNFPRKRADQARLIYGHLLG